MLDAARQLRGDVVDFFHRYADGGADLLTTETDDQGRSQFLIWQQGDQGRPRRLPATAATATVLSSLTTATDFPLLYALYRRWWEDTRGALTEIGFRRA